MLKYLIRCCYWGRRLKRFSKSKCSKYTSGEKAGQYHKLGIFANGFILWGVDQYACIELDRQWIKELQEMDQSDYNCQCAA